MTIIEFSFDTCNIYHNGPRGVGYPVNARSVGDSRPCSTTGEGANGLLSVRELRVSYVVGFAREGQRHVNYSPTNNQAYLARYYFLESSLTLPLITFNYLVVVALQA